MGAPIGWGAPAWLSLGWVRGGRGLGWVCVWSWGSSGLGGANRRTTSAPPRQVPGRADPEARFSHFKSPQQRSIWAAKPVNSEQDSCSQENRRIMNLMAHENTPIQLATHS